MNGSDQKDIYCCFVLIFIGGIHHHCFLLSSSSSTTTPRPSPSTFLFLHQSSPSSAKAVSVQACKCWSPNNKQWPCPPEARAKSSFNSSTGSWEQGVHGRSFLIPLCCWDCHRKPFVLIIHTAASWLLKSLTLAFIHSGWAECRVQDQWYSPVQYGCFIYGEVNVQTQTFKRARSSSLTSDFIPQWL